MDCASIRKKFVFRKKPFIPRTLGEEVEEILREWYANLGQTIPPDELKICRDIDINAAEEEKKYLATPLKAVYGTPDFWKSYWEKKRNSSKGAIGKQTRAAPKYAKYSLQDEHRS
jgi:hypothetical protein